MEIHSHRANAQGFVENTLDAFKYVIKNGVKAIETDVHMTKDGVLVINHDGFLGHIYEGFEAISDLTFEELQNHACRIEGHEKLRIPRLSDVLTLCVENQVELNIEIKLEEYHNYHPMVLSLIKLVETMGAQDWVYYSSFHLPTLLYMRKANPEAKLYWLLDIYIPGLFDYLQSLNLNGLHLSIKIWKQMLDDERQKLLKTGTVRLWTVNDTEDVKFSQETQVDAIMTDRALDLI